MMGHVYGARLVAVNVNANVNVNNLHCVLVVR